MKNKVTVIYWLLMIVQVFLFLSFKYYSIKASELFDYKAGLGNYEAAQAFSNLAMRFAWAWYAAIGSLFALCIFHRDLRSFYSFGMLLAFIFLEFVSFLFL